MPEAGLGRSAPPQVDSDKLVNELHNYAQMYWEPEAWQLHGRSLKCRGENLIARHVSSARRATTYKHIFSLFVFVLFYVKQVKRQKIWLLFWNKECLYCCCAATGQGFTPKLDKVFFFTRSYLFSSYTATTNVQDNSHKAIKQSEQ